MTTELFTFGGGFRCEKFHSARFSRGVDEFEIGVMPRRPLPYSSQGSSLMFIQKKAPESMSSIINIGVLMTWPAVVSRTIPLQNRRARLRLENAVWSGLDDIAQKERRPVHDLCIEVDALRSPDTPLTSAIRNFVLDYYRQAESL
ncbi:ribbon-helix-helix domain-containing protein [Azospirillum sp. B506]|uniref:ribbon-helix-helix domain-containing protein n=1 Tax=Azospirillum sp. B506 TaxID=137721 RepID=UPI000A05DA43|nr:ribbon-helix-helix domain-containing protein [Azospirillum sp. B506]